MLRTDYVAPLEVWINHNHNHNHNLNGMRNFKDTFTLYGIQRMGAITGNTMLKVCGRPLLRAPTNQN